MIVRHIVVVYIYPNHGAPVHGGDYGYYAARFVETYRRLLPTIPHRLLVVSNGGPPTPQMQATFAGLPVDWRVHDNSGYDIGGFQFAAKVCPCELMVFFGTTAYLRRPGWLERMVEAYDKHGVGLYGSSGNRGDQRFNVHPHIRTTGFWLPPLLLNEYPFKIVRPDQRYPFEHGTNCLTNWIKALQLKILVVTYAGEYPWEQWDTVPHGYHNGDQRNLIAGDRLTEPPHYSPG